MDTPTVEAVRFALRLEPLPAGATEQLLSSRPDLTLPPRVLRALVERTAGNPFWALEVGRAVAAEPPDAEVVVALDEGAAIARARGATAAAAELVELAVDFTSPDDSRHRAAAASKPQRCCTRSVSRSARFGTPRPTMPRTCRRSFADARCHS